MMAHPNISDVSPGLSVSVTARPPTLSSLERGIPIARPSAPEDVVPNFIAWMCEQDFVGERTWRSIWEFYEGWYCPETDQVSLPKTMKNRFAFELSKYAVRGQIRVYENGRLRRLTTYNIPTDLQTTQRCAA